MTDQPVAIIGAGLAGCLLATLLSRRGIPVTVYERRPDPRVAGPERGRSINLAISARGLAALDQVGLREQALARALPMHGRMVHSLAGERSFRPYSADGTHAINSISRAELNGALLDCAERSDGVRIQFSSRLRDTDLATGTLVFETESGAGGQAKAGIVLAADGAYSVARRAVTFRPGFTFSQDYLEHGYKELTIPPRDGDFALDPDALHIWPRGSSMMIALPNTDRSFTCTLFWTAAEFAALAPAAGPAPGPAFDSEADPAPAPAVDSEADPAPAPAVDRETEIYRYFSQYYGDVVDLMPSLADDYAHNPVGPLVTIRCWPWVHHGCGGRGDGATLALVGDAAHAIVPFFGQGANCALEDCVEIVRCLAETGDSWPDALDVYAERRKADCDAIADMSLDNFVEMRDRVNSKLFRARAEAGHFLERRLPGRYASRYELVSFSTVPYAEVPHRAGLRGMLRRMAR